MNADGSDAKNLTENQGQNTYPAWSRDGKKIAFISTRDGNSAIYVMDADGKNVKQLTNGERVDRAPAWSPDGKKIAFCRHLGNNWEIFVMEADGANQVNLTDDPARDADPAWSPDGKKIAFASNRSGQGYRLYVVDTDGKNVQDVSKADNRRGYVYPAWSPDGKIIAYSELIDNDVEIFLAGADGSFTKQLTKLGGLNTLAAWSADGKKMAFLHTSFDAETGSLYVMDANGNDPKEVLKDEAPVEGGRPAWQPK